MWQKRTDFVNILVHRREEWDKISTMHDAFEADPILDKLPLGIESIACYGKLKTRLKLHDENGASL